MIAAVCAGLAGSLFATVEGYLAPSAFPYSLSIMFVAAVVIGGLGSMSGAIVGVALIQLLPNVGASFQQYALLVYGVLLIATMYFIPNGAVPSLRKLWIWSLHTYTQRRGRVPGGGGSQLDTLAERKPPTTTSPVSLHKIESPAPLVIEAASKRFGSVQALRRVSMTAHPGTITGVIGANGSGKTTLLNVIQGFYRLDEGSISVGGHDLTRRAPWRVARSGVALYIPRACGDPREISP